jgi:hypothetical protein
MEDTAEGRKVSRERTLGWDEGENGPSHDDLNSIGNDIRDWTEEMMRSEQVSEGCMRFEQELGDCMRI